MLGFQMLHQLRNYFPQTQSMLMDESTFEAFRKFSVSVAPPTPMQLPQLTEAEQAMYQRLLSTSEGNRLEQEHISQAWVLQVLAGM